MTIIHYFITKNKQTIRGSVLINPIYDRLSHYNIIKQFDFGNCFVYNKYKNFQFFTNQLIADLKTKCSKYNNYYYPIFSHHSTPVPMTNVYKFKTIISEDAFDDDEWETIVMEATSNQADLDEIEMAVETITKNIGEFYEPTTTRIRGDLTFYKLTIICHMFSGISRLSASCCRQAGENLMLISDSLDADFLNNYPNAQAYKPGASWKFDLLTNEMVYILVSFSSGTPLGFVECYDLLNVKVNNNDYQNLAYIHKNISIDISKWVRSDAGSLNEMQRRLNKEKEIAESEKHKNEEASTSTSEEKKDDFTELLIKCESEGLPNEVSKSLKQLTSQGGEFNQDMTSALKDLLESSMNEQKIKKILKNEVSNVIQHKIKDRSQLESIMQVPLMHQRGSRNEKTRPNMHFREERIRAEIDSISTELTDKIISGTLTITSEDREELSDIIELCEGYVLSGLSSPEANFFILLIKLILNDAYNVNTSSADQTAIWTNIRRKLVSKVVKTKGRLSLSNDPLSLPLTGATLNYNFAGYPNE
jgi:hypothetical protein